MSNTPEETSTIELPNLDCGLCGMRTCAEMAVRLQKEPKLIERCIHLSDRCVTEKPATRPAATERPSVNYDAPCSTVCAATARRSTISPTATWQDSLGRDFDFYLEHFPEDPGPREIIIPHNPMLTREMNISPGDILIGRPLGMSCGCPITHCGVVRNVDARTGVIVWCVTGPLNPREKGFKDLGYYIAEGYEGLVTQTRAELKIGMRYFFQPRLCMLQWRHSGLINFLNRTPSGHQVRVEGLWIG